MSENMRNRNDFDRDFDRLRRRFRVMWRVTTTALIVLWLAVIVGLGWALLHPEAIGAWVARLVSPVMGGGHG